MNRFAVTFIAGTMCVGALALGGCATRRGLAEGLRLQADGRHREAWSHFEAMARDYPGDAEIAKYAATARGLAFRSEVRQAESSLRVDDLQDFLDGMKRADQIQPSERVRLVIDLVETARIRGETDAAILGTLRKAMRAGKAPPVGEAMDQAAEALRQKLAESDLAPIAFLDMEGDIVEPVKAYVLHTLSEHVVRAGVVVCDRSKRDEVLQEALFSRSDLSDPSFTIEAGRLLGARALVAGTLTSKRSEMVLHLRLIETETARVAHHDSIVFDIEDLPDAPTAR